MIDPKLKGISSAKCYKFKGDANGDARMFYKDAMISKEDKPRPYQPGDRFVPRSEAEAQSTFGVLWDASSEEVRPMQGYTRVHEFKFEFGGRVELEFEFEFEFRNSHELELLRTRTRETHIKIVENSNSNELATR